MKYLPPVILDIYDEDKKILFNETDFLGRSIIYLKNASCRFIDKTNKNVLFAFNNKSLLPIDNFNPINKN